MSQLNPIESGYYWARLASGKTTVVAVSVSLNVLIDMFWTDAATSFDQFTAEGNVLIERIKEPPGEALCMPL